MKTILKNAGIVSTVSLVSLLSACAGLNGVSPNIQPTQPAQLSPASPSAIKTCETLAAGFKFDNTTLDSVVAIAAGTVATGTQPNSPPTAYRAPAYCLIA